MSESRTIAAADRGAMVRPTARRRKRLNGGSTGPALVLPALIVVAGFYLMPAVYNVYLSVRRVTLFDMMRGGSSWAFLDNYARLFTSEDLLALLLNTSLWLTGVTVLARIVLGIAIALVLNTTVMRRRGLSALSRSLIVLPWTMPPVAAILVWQLLLQPNYGAANQVLAALHLVPEGGISWLQHANTAWVAIEGMIVWRELPLVVLMFLAGLQTIPTEVFEAARVDGAGPWQTTRHIVLPLLRPVTVVASLLTVIWTFNNFVYVWLATGGGPGNATDVLGTAIYKIGFVRYDIGLSAAAAVVGTVIMLIFAVAYFMRTWQPSDAA